MIIAGILILLLLIFLFYASYSIEAGIYIRSFCRKQTDEKIVALTFDDGPDSTQTPKILDVLKAHHAPATFFCIGSKINGNEAILQRILAEGHILGNHSYSHTWQFPFYSLRRMTEELEQCQALLEKATRTAGNAHPPVHLFRPPFGVTNPIIARTVKKLGYRSIGWNIRTLDTQALTHEKILNRIRKKLRPGSILLLHDRMPQSEQLLTEIINLLHAEHYRIADMENLLSE